MDNTAPQASDDTGVAQPTATSIGAQLREAREASKISVSEAAKKLHLTKSVIDNLEVDAWDKLSGRTYARGHLLSYARFLGVPEPNLLAQFDENYQEELPPLKVHKNKIEKRGTPWLKLVLLGLIAAAVWFVFQQWPNIKNKYITQVETLADEETVVLHSPAMTNPVVAPETIATPGIAEPEEPIAIAPISTQVGNNQVTALTLPASISSDSEEVAEAMSVTQEASPVVDNVIPVVEAEEISTNIDDSEAEPVVSTTNPQDPMQSTLALVFGGECWVSVKDAVGTTLLHDTKQLGEHAVLQGNPPFRVILGNASNVRVTFNGNSFNTSPFTKRGGVARFTLDNKQP